MPDACGITPGVLTSPWLHPDNGGHTAAILSSFTSTCRRHEINPQLFLTQLLANLPDTRVSRIDEWLPDQWKKRQAQPVEAPPAQD